MSNLGNARAVGIALGVLLSASTCHAAFALPTGGKVISGQVSVSPPAGGAITVSQSTSKAIIDWSTFSIGAHQSVIFYNGSGATLNRVTGADASTIDGYLASTGSVYLINPNGMIIGKNGVVNIGGTFVASTLDEANADFNNGGSMTFNGSSGASVINLGSIDALGGDIVLMANNVRNYGSVWAPKGDIGLLAGASVFVRDMATDEGKFAVEMGAPGSSVVNDGSLQAAMVELRANGGNVYALAGNTGGVINATGISTDDGKIFLVAGEGYTDVQGSMTATQANGAGGQVLTAGDNVGIVKANVTAANWIIQQDAFVLGPDRAAALASSLASTDITVQTLGVDGGGVGGDITIGSRLAWTGPHALTLTSSNDIVVNAAMSFSNGGLNLAAPNGALTINAPVKVTGPGAVSITTNETVDGADLSFGLSPRGFAGSLSFDGKYRDAQTLNINDQSYILLYSLAEKGSTGPDDGTTDIAGIDHAGDSGYYALANNVAGTGTAAKAQFNSSLVGDDNTGGSGSAFTGIFEGLGHSIKNLTINDPYPDDYVGLFGANSGTVRDVGVLGGSVSSQTGAYIGGLVGANFGSVRSATLANVFATDEVLAPDGENVGGLAGGNLAIHFSALIDNSFATGAVGGGALDAGGLVGWVTSGNASASITNSYATGSATSRGGGGSGGLVGFVEESQSFATLIENDFATGSAAGGYWSGGLIGLASDGLDSFINVHASGAAVGTDFAGGLIGQSGSGSIVNAYATGSASAEQAAGGLIGANLAGVAPSTILDAYATGAVSGGSKAYLGGLIGEIVGGVTENYTKNGITYNYFPASISVAYATGSVTGGQYSGGLVGYDNAVPASLPSISEAFATGQVVGQSYAGGLLGFITTSSTAPSVSNTYATGSVSGPITGGLIGYNSGAVVTTSYWDRESTGQTTEGRSGPGDSAKGLTTTQLQHGGARFTGTDFTGGSGGTYPYLIGLPSPYPQ